MLHISITTPCGFFVCWFFCLLVYLFVFCFGGFFFSGYICLKCLFSIHLLCSCVSWRWKWVFYRQHLESCVNSFNHPLFLLIREFNLFTFKVIIDSEGLSIAILLYFLVALWICFSLFLILISFLCFDVFWHQCAFTFFILFFCVITIRFLLVFTMRLI